ncbi:uncharacterized protein LOC113279231 [Papaver somniferum]|uniref:uncharacterized protein LOC113279231 n=1 Tax=Papaver somniferum TaxID=3469 RepID=UPI000E6FCE5F|nr:uncharacterized protein LOC113279231 [Papaver somniferum]
MDLANEIPSKIIVESKYGKFEQAVNIPNLPKFCYHCKIVGHLTAECRNKRREYEEKKKGDNAVYPVETKKVWRKITPKKKQQDTSGFDICYSANEVGEASTPASQVPVKTQEQINNSAKFHVLQNMNDEAFSSQVEFPVILVSNILSNASSALYVNKVSSGVPTISVSSAPSDNKVTSVPPTNKGDAKDSNNNKGSKVKKKIHEVQKPFVISLSDQAITVEVGDTFVTGIHAASLTVQRRSLWEELVDISLMNKPWLAMGDFNTVMREEEKKGGLRPMRISMMEFNNCLYQCGLMQAPKIGLEFSWCNNRAGKKRILCNLDREVFNDKWLEKFPSWKYKVGVRSISDHSTLHGENADIPKPSNTPFRALKRMKVDLKEWNWSTFGDVNKKLKQAEENVMVATVASDNNIEDTFLLNKLVTTRGIQEILEQQKREITHQKSRVMWLKDGSANSNSYQHENKTISKYDN